MLALRAKGKNQSFHYHGFCHGFSLAQRTLIRIRTFVPKKGYHNEKVSHDYGLTKVFHFHSNVGTPHPNDFSVYPCFFFAFLAVAEILLLLTSGPWPEELRLIVVAGLPNHGRR